MAKLIVLALAFTALVAFAAAHTTIVTTVIGDDNPVSRGCSQQMQQERFDQCERYLQQQGQQQQGVQQCCQELERVQDQCQCEAVQQIFRNVQRQQQQQTGQQGGRYGSQQLQRLKSKAQNLPNQCNLRIRQCPIRTIMTTTTTTDDNPSWSWPIPFGSGGQCSRSEIQQRSFDQCQNFIEQQVSRYSPRTLLMSINRKGGQGQQGLQQCCNELNNVRRDCQCDAMNEVFRQTIQQMQGGQYRGQQQGRQYGGQQQQGRQHGGQQQQGGGRYGGGQEEMVSTVSREVQNLQNLCNLDVQQQCQIPSAMF